MSRKSEVSHRQEKEKEKQSHAQSTPGERLTSKNPGWKIVVAVIFIGAAVIVWTFL